MGFPRKKPQALSMSAPGRSLSPAKRWAAERAAYQQPVSGGGAAEAQRVCGGGAASSSSASIAASSAQPASVGSSVPVRALDGGKSVVIDTEEEALP